MRILVAGDSHGVSSHITTKIDIAKSLGADRILVVGDWGHWPGFGGIEFLDAVNAYARDKDIRVYTLGGNHDWWDDWERIINNPGAVKDGAKFVYVRSHILYAPKIHNWTWDGKRFFIVGGAVSIDKQWRKPGESWWANEALTESEIASVEKYAGPDIDYLFTHDASDHTSWGFDLIPDPDSQAHRRYIDRAIAALKPRMQFHGHMHHKYDWINYESHGRRYAMGQWNDEEWNGKSTYTYGLDCNGENYSWGILDTGQDRWLWSDRAVTEFYRSK